MDNDADEQILQSLEGTGKIKGRPSVNAFKKGLTKQPPSAKSNDFSQNRYFGKDQKNPTGLGDWEKNTKGIGSKLLMKVCELLHLQLLDTFTLYTFLQMGYQPGKGLGKSLQGRAQPVEAQVRKGRGAVGTDATFIVLTNLSGKLNYSILYFQVCTGLSTKTSQELMWHPMKRRKEITRKSSPTGKEV